MQRENNLCDEKVYMHVYQRHASELYRFLTYQFNGAIDAEDITQSIFLKLWERCSEFHLDNIKSLIFTMGKNLGINQLKKTSKNDQFSHQIYGFSEAPDSLLEEKEIRIQLQNALKTLSPKERIVFLMNRMDDMPYREIAERLEISQKAVEKRMHNALKKLKEATALNLKIK